MKIVIALGGNALSDAKIKGETYEEQLCKIEETAKGLVKLIKEKHSIVITHGNGPQVGSLLLQQQAKIADTTHLPLKILGALTQGQIGVSLQHALINHLRKENIEHGVYVIPTTVLVNKNDKGFKNPTKPIGPFYTYEEYLQNKGKFDFTLKDKGYRRVVPSPIPLKILEAPLIKQLVEKKDIVIAVGGGGTPTIDNGQLNMVDAVIDKDLASAEMAKSIDADALIIVTNVDGVFKSYGEKDQELLKQLDISSANELLETNKNAMSGSMEPKIRACLEFAKVGKTAIITSSENILAALNGTAGTRFIK